MTMTPEVAVGLYLESEHRLFSGPRPAVAVVDVSRVPARATSTSGAAGEAPAVDGCPSRLPAMTPATAAPLRLHVAHLRSNPRSGIGQWVCEFTWRYRRALGDSRRDALRRAFKCAHSHREVIHVR